MKGFLKATAKGKWVHLLVLCWCYLCSVTHREMRGFILLPGQPSQGFSMLALWDQCLYTEWENVSSWGMSFLQKTEFCRVFCCCYCCFDLVCFLNFNRRLLEFGNHVVFWWLGGFGQSYKGKWAYHTWDL